MPETETVKVRVDACGYEIEREDLNADKIRSVRYIVGQIVISKAKREWVRLRRRFWFWAGVKGRRLADTKDERKHDRGLYFLLHSSKKTLRSHEDGPGLMCLWSTIDCFCFENQKRENGGRQRLWQWLWEKTESISGRETMEAVIKKQTRFCWDIVKLGESNWLRDCSIAHEGCCHWKAEKGLKRMLMLYVGKCDENKYVMWKWTDKRDSVWME